MKKIIFKLANNEQAYVCTPVEEEFNLQHFLSTVGNVESFIEIDSSLLPSNAKEFINCRIWDETKNNKISYDINKSKEVVKNKFRKLRKPILENLDVEFLKALEAGNIEKQQEIAVKKQELRDVTNITLSNDFEELKNFIPDILK